MEKSRLNEIREKLIKEKAEREAMAKEMWNKMKPFQTADDIPDLPKADWYESIVVPNLIRCGAIPKEDLEVGTEYEGSCRNSSRATWDGKRFNYKRYKFGMWEDDSVNHFQDDDGFDLFVPIRKIKEGED